MKTAAGNSAAVNYWREWGKPQARCRFNSGVCRNTIPAASRCQGLFSCYAM